MVEQNPIVIERVKKSEMYRIACPFFNFPDAAEQYIPITHRQEDKNKVEVKATDCNNEQV